MKLPLIRSVAVLAMMALPFTGCATAPNNPNSNTDIRQAQTHKIIMKVNWLRRFQPILA
jgi:outer membrane lipoprotein SlyB